MGRRAFSLAEKDGDDGSPSTQGGGELSVWPVVAIALFAAGGVALILAVYKADIWSLGVAIGCLFLSFLAWNLAR
jgi:hypothetical protein